MNSNLHYCGEFVACIDMYIYVGFIYTFYTFLEASKCLIFFLPIKEKKK